jgi:hypothetical protein
VDATPSGRKAQLVDSQIAEEQHHSSQAKRGDMAMDVLAGAPLKALQQMLRTGVRKSGVGRYNRMAP